MNYSTFPRAIEIQTISSCNAKCVICPHPEVSSELPSGMMSMDLFRRIIDQIDPSADCRIIPYLNSEPLLDVTIIDRLRYVREHHPHQELELSTNVSALTPTKQQALTGISLTELRLSVFGFTEQTHRIMMPGLRWESVKRNLDHMVGNQSFRRHIQDIGIVMIQHELITDTDVTLVRAYCAEHGLSCHVWGFLDRAGNVAQYSNQIHRSTILGCEQRRPLERMHITFNGNVILCCQDWRWSHIIGNVSTESLLQIWNSPAYEKYRRSIYEGLGTQPEICSKCKLSIPRD